MALSIQGFPSISDVQSGGGYWLWVERIIGTGKVKRYKISLDNLINNVIPIEKVGDAITIGDANDTTTVPGNVVLGTDATNTVTFNATVVNFSGANALTFEGTGADDAFETTIAVANPAADRVYTFPDVGGNANVVLSTSTVQQLLSSSQAAANAIRFQASNAAGGIDIDSGTAGIAIDSTGAVSLQGAAASDFSVSGAGIDLTLASAAGRVVVNGEEAAADAVRIFSAAGGVDVDAALQINITSSQSALDAIRFLTTGFGGGIDIDTANGVGGNGGPINITTGNATDVNNNGGNVLFTLGSGFGAGNGGSFTITGSAGGATGTGSAIGITGGASAGAGGTAGSVTIDAGAAALGTLGTMSLGTVNSGQINISRAGQTTAVAGVLTVGETSTLTGNVTIGNNSSIQTTMVSGDLFRLNAYDNDLGAYVSFVTITAGNAPSFALAVPAGGATATINGAVIGGVSAAAGTFTTLTANTSLTINNTGAGADPSFASTDAGQVLDLTGSLDISGALTLGTDLAVAQGGTGVSTFGGVNTILFTTAADTLSSIVTAVSGVLVTSGAGVPSISTDIPTAVTIGGAYVYRGGGTDVAMLDGGTGASLAAVGGGIVYSGAAAMAISAAGTSLQALVSGGAGAPTWSAITIDGTVANVVNIANGTGSLNVAAGIVLDVNANLTVNSAVTMAAYADIICNIADEAAFKAATNLEAGTDFHAYTANGNTILTDAGLLNIAGVATVADRFLTTTGVDTWAAQAITASGIALVGRTIAVDQIHYGNGAGSYLETGLTAAARSILDDASVPAIATTLGLGTGDSPTFVGLNLTGQLNVDVANTPALLTSTINGVSVQVGYFEGTKGAGAALDGDEIFVSFGMKNDAAAQVEIARLYAAFMDVNVGTGTDSELQFSVITAGALAKELALSGTALYPSTDDGLILGSATNRFSDLFLALGAVLNFDNGDVTITHAANSLTVDGGTFNATGGGALTGTWSDLGSVAMVDINSGTVDGTIIGGAVAAAGTFTTCDATTDFTVGSLVITSNVITATGRITTAMTTPTVGTGFDGAQTALWAIKGRVGAAGPVISEFIVDLTNLINSTTLNDIIGESAAVANCHFGQVTAAIQGTVQAMEIVCLETPVGGDPDIDFYSATESTGAENALVTDLTETLLFARGASWANGDVRGVTTVPGANEYLYLAVGAGGAPGTYTAGKFKVTIYGTV